MARSALAEDAEPLRPAIYIDLIPVVISLVPDSPRLFQLYYEHPVHARIVVFGTLLGAYASGASVPDADSEFDLQGLGAGLGVRYYVAALRGGQHRFYAQANLNGGPFHLEETSATGTVESASGSAILSYWAVLGYRYTRGHFTGFVQAGLDHLLLPIEPEAGAFSQGLRDLFKLDGGIKPTASLAIGYSF